MGHAAHMGQRRDACKLLVGDPQGKKLLGRTTNSQEDNTEMDLRKLAWVWTGLIWFRVVPSGRQVINLPIPQKAGNFLIS
jgi:hypothetical protein